MPATMQQITDNLKESHLISLLVLGVGSSISFHKIFIRKDRTADSLNWNTVGESPFVGFDNCRSLAKLTQQASGPASGRCWAAKLFFIIGLALL